MLFVLFASGFMAINATDDNPAMSGSILPVPLACFVIRIAFPFGSTLAFPTHHCIIRDPLWRIDRLATLTSIVLIALLSRQP